MAVAVTESLDELLGRLWSNDPELMADPSRLWRRLHDEAPVHRFGASILFSRYADVREIHMHALDWGTHGVPRGSTEADAIMEQLDEEGRAVLTAMLAFEDLFMSRTGDRDRHDRLRQIAHPIFTPRRITDLRAAAEVMAAELLDRVEGGVCDLITFCHDLPLLVIASVLGVPKGDIELIRQWSTRLAAATQRTPPNPAALHDGLAAIDEFRAYVTQLVEDQRQHPESVSPFVAAILAAEGEHRASPDEVAAMFVNFLFAGHETTSNLISIGVAELLASPGQWALLAADPSLVDRATEELLRHVSPAQWGPMNAIVDFELGGTQIRAGDTVMIMVAAANRDPSVFEEPDRLDINRANARDHQAFGVGPRYCIGQAVARMEAQIALGELARRWPKMELAADTLEFHGISMLRRLKSLPVALG